MHLRIVGATTILGAGFTHFIMSCGTILLLEAPEEAAGVPPKDVETWLGSPAASAPVVCV